MNLKTVQRSPFWAMLRKEFIQMRRDRITLMMMVGLPAVQLALFGYAIRMDVRNLRAATAVFDYDRNRWSTDGRAIFNLNPTEAIQFYQANLELVAQEAART